MLCRRRISFKANLFAWCETSQPQPTTRPVGHECIEAKIVGHYAFLQDMSLVQEELISLLIQRHSLDKIILAPQK
jgi:hypothetical protein